MQFQPDCDQWGAPKSSQTQVTNGSYFKQIVFEFQTQFESLHLFAQPDSQPGPVRGPTTLSQLTDNNSWLTNGLTDADR